MTWGSTRHGSQCYCEGNLHGVYRLRQTNASEAGPDSNFVESVTFVASSWRSARIFCSLLSNDLIRQGIIDAFSEECARRSEEKIRVVSSGD